MALRIAFVVGAAAVVLAVTVVDRTVEGTPMAADVQVDPSAPRLLCDGENNLTASGSSHADRAFGLVAAAYQDACPGTTVTYDPVGSGGGIQQYLEGTTHLAVADRQLADDERQRAYRLCDEVEQLPLVAQPITVRYRLPGVDDLTLDAPTLAKIYSGAITGWHDPAIAALNPGTELPALPITVMGRADESTETTVFGQYLAAAGGITVMGEPKVAGLNSTGVLRMIETTDGAIGYLTPQDSTRSEVLLLNGVAPDPAAVAAAVNSALPGYGLAFEPAELYRTPAAGAYPLAIVSYAIACDGDPAVRDFLLSSLSAQGDETAFVLPAGAWAGRLEEELQ